MNTKISIDIQENVVLNNAGGTSETTQSQTTKQPVEQDPSLMAAKENIKLNETFEFEECPICFEDFDTKNHKQIVCGCTYSICLECAKNCMIQIEKTPHCIHCKREWNRDYLYQNIGKKFINGDYKDTRKKLLYEQEKGKMAFTVPRVAIHNKAKEYDVKIKELKKQYDVLNYKMIQLKREQHNLIYEKRVLLNGKQKQDKKEKIQFIKPCPADGCRGFLSTAYKCEICNTKVCAKCLEIKSQPLEDGDEHAAPPAEHICDENNVKNAEMIKKETKPCPKCGVRIFKISGCDQMWCTQCNIAFSWKNGTVETGIIHNPHYYEFMKKQNNGNIQNPGAERCGGLFQMWNAGFLINFGNYKITMEQYNPTNNVKKHFVFGALYRETKQYSNIRDLIASFHGKYTHLLRAIVDPLREQLRQNNDNEDLRIKYLNHEYDEKQFITQIFKRDNIREKKTAMLQVFELYLNVLLDNLLHIHNTLLNLHNKKKYLSSTIPKAIFEFLTNIYNVIYYCNKQLESIAVNYNMKVYYIDHTTGHVKYEKMFSKTDIKQFNLVSSANQIISTIDTNKNKYKVAVFMPE